MIEIQDVSTSYGPTRVLDGVTLTIPAGGVTSLIGPNGAGKSTLLSVMARLLTPDSGRVLVDGTDVATTPGRDVARRLAVLRQDTHLSVRLTVRELVALGRFPHSGGRLTPEDRVRVAEAISFVELDDLADRRLDQLSGGQRQRAHVAMVLCQDTDYVLLDEPLAALDMRHAVSMMRLLRRLALERGKTIVIVIHDVNFASCHSDRIVALRDGRVAVEGPTAEVMEDAVLAAIYGTDVAVHDIGGRRIGVYYG